MKIAIFTAVLCRLAVLVVFLLMPLGLRAETLPPVVSALSVSDDARGTVIDIVSTQPLSFQPFFLSQPPRLILDHENILFHIQDQPLPAGIVTASRFGQMSGRSARFVFDLTGPSDLVSQDTFERKDGFFVSRFVLHSVSQSAFQKAQSLFRKYVPSPSEQATPDQNTPSPPTRNKEQAPAPSPSPPAPSFDLIHKEGQLRVVIDPGHGGLDPGALGQGDVVEKNLTLSYAQMIAQVLREAGFDVLLTRDNDQFVSLSDRVRFTEASQADLFISIHADSFGDSPLRGLQNSVRGASIYTFSHEASNAETEAYAARENASDVLAGVEGDDLSLAEAEIVSGILGDLHVRETRRLSQDFSVLLHASLSKTLKFHKVPRKQARFKVLSTSLVPSVLLEIGYLSSNNDLAKLTQDDTIKATAHAIKMAVTSYVKWTSPTQN